MTAVTREVLDAIHDRRIPQADTELFATFRPWKRTDAEVAAGVTPVNYAYAPGDVRRYGGVPDTNTDQWSAIQAAIDSCSSRVYIPTGIWKIDRPLLIRPTSFQNLIIEGESRTNTYLAPLNIDISNGPENLNTLIVNQADNHKLTIRNLRFWSDVAYTGNSIYAVEGGGADALGQAIFSGAIESCWFGMGSTNAGVFRGALNNYRVVHNVFEFAKGCFYREGIGMGDVIFDDNQVYFSWDAFYDGMTDTEGDNVVTITNLHVYIHQRGQVIQTQNSENMTISGVKLQAADGVSNLGSVGLFKFVDGINILVSDFNAAQITSFGGSGPLDEVITIQGTEVKFSNGVINVPSVGIRVTGASASYVDINSVDIVNAQTCAFQTQSGNTTGRVTAHNSNWSDSQANCILFSNAVSFDFFLNNMRIMNAGLGGSSGARNISLETSGRVRISDCVIGQDNAGAAAAFYFDASGLGTLTLVDTLLQGTPPSGVVTGSQSITYDGASGTWTPSIGGTATYTVQQGTYSVKSKCVTFWGRLTINAIGTGSATTVSGLPFTSNSSYYGCGVAPFFASIAATVTSLSLTVAPSASSFVFRGLTAAAASSVNPNVLQNAADVIFSGSYQIP